MNESYARNVLAGTYGLCDACAALWAAWYVSAHSKASAHAVKVRKDCTHRQAKGLPCAPTKGKR